MSKLNNDIRKQIEDRASQYMGLHLAGGVEISPYATFDQMAMERAFQAGAEFGLGLASEEIEGIKRCLSSQSKLMNTMFQKRQHPITENMQIEIERLKSEDSYELQFVRQERDQLAAEAQELRMQQISNVGQIQSALEERDQLKAEVEIWQDRLTIALFEKDQLKLLAESLTLKLAEMRNAMIYVGAHLWCQDRSELRKYLDKMIEEARAALEKK